MHNLDDFTRHYIIAALSFSYDTARAEGFNDDVTLDQNYGIEDIAPETMERIKQDCAQFQEQNQSLLQQAYPLYKPHPDAPRPECAAGHDFWLTRNHHGAGFWDRGFPPALGQALTSQAHLYGECDIYVGDDDKLYI